MQKALLAVVGIAALLAPTVAASSADATYMEEESFVVSFEQMPRDLNVGGIYDGARVKHVDIALGFGVLSAPRTRGLAAELSSDANIRSIEKDERVQLIDVVPDDPLFQGGYGPQVIRAPAAWDAMMGSASATICFVDTGARYTHEDLAGPRWLGGYDFENKDDDPMDDNGHGTHVAGTAAATAGNGRGTAGIAQVGFYAVKALDANGGGATSNVASGVRWCADKGANVISLSLGSSSPTSIMQDAVRYAAARGSLVIAAAGNSGPCSNCVGYPAAFAEVMAVTCVDAKKAPCEFSSNGRESEIAAPGHKIAATWHTNDRAYNTISGTSMSTPHVAGVAALVFSAAPELKASQVREILRSSSVDLGRRGWDVDYGNGLVDARAAIERAMGGNLPEPTDPSPTPDDPSNPTDPFPTPKPQPSNLPPVANAGEDIVVSDGNNDREAVVFLNASDSNDTDGRIVSYEWQRYGRTIATGAMANATLRTGRHTLELVVTDNGGKSSKDTIRVEVLRNERPTAVFTYECAGLTCTFDGSASTDPDGSIVRHEWSIGSERLEGALVKATFARDGQQRVRLTVYDDGGDRGYTYDRILVLPPAMNAVWTETFDSGAAGWEASDNAHNLWHVSGECAAVARGGKVLAFDNGAPSCDHAGGRTQGSMTSPAIDIGDAQRAALRFLHHRTEDDSRDARDVMRVEISTNGGRWWRSLEDWRAGDASAGWEEVTIDISHYASEDLMIRFTYDARSDRGNEAPGWSIDDVTILAA